MADDRPILSSDEQLAEVTKQLEDLRTTVLARLATRPTGDIEQTLRTTAKAGALLMQGQTILRLTYPLLWQWAQDQSLVGVANLFGNGDGSTTFTLPDLRGRVLVGVGTLGTDTYALGNVGGSAFKTLTVANLANHDHNGIATSTGTTGGHTHGFGTSSDGGHGGHTNAPASTPAFAAGGGSLPTFYNNFYGTHSHSGGTDNQGNHSHSVTVDVNPTGSGTAFDGRPPYFALNWMIYT